MRKKLILLIIGIIKKNFLRTLDSRKRLEQMEEIPGTNGRHVKAFIKALISQTTSL
jgi:hypothetical protein